MDKLARCIETYEQMLNIDYLITLENDIILDIFFQKENFVHLVGLHKLTDINQVVPSASNPAKRIYRDLVQGKIQYSDIAKSSLLHKIQDRLEAFPQIETVFDKKVVVDFNPALVKHTKIISEFILYREYGDGYIHLGIGAGVRRGYFPETFFYESNSYYLSEQKLLDVIDVQKIERTKKRLRYRGESSDSTK